MLKNYRFVTIAAVATLSLFNLVSAQKAPLQGTTFYQLPANARIGTDYVTNAMILKVKPQYRSLTSERDINHPAFKALMNQMGIQDLTKIFPEEQPLTREYNARGEKMVDLSLIYECTFSNEMPLQQALNKAAMVGLFEYVVPKTICRYLYTVSDPSAASQYHLATIKATTAWDISKGDTNVVIGNVDAGIDYTHPDLVKNIKYNPNDPPNGTDDDNDGYVDNYRGWDVGTKDNNATWEGSDPGANHGMYTAGISSASTDNAVGVAGTGFKCKFLPVKVSDKTGALKGQEWVGIVYAAKHGCKVINCSWGTTGDPGLYGADIVNSATFNYDALVVGGSGNDGVDELFYPAAYKNALSVAATDQSDKFQSWSSYSNTVGVSAPGASITTTAAGGYSTVSGTSMACPVVAGAAGIVRSYFPSYSALQTSQRLRVTADNVYSLTGNTSASYKDKFGSGRVNLYRALNDPAVCSILMTSNAITNKGGKAITSGDTISISGVFTNYLAPSSSNLKVTLSTASTYVTVLAANATSTLGTINTMGTANNNATPFRVRVKPTSATNVDVLFKLTYTDGTYSAFEFFHVIVNVDYLNVNVNQIATSITSTGRVGWNNDPPTQGLGFRYNSDQMSYETSLMVGVPDSAVSNHFRAVTGINTDFIATVNARRVTTNAMSDFDAETYFTDASAQQKLPILVHQKTYAWSAIGDDKYVMFRYFIHNTGTKTLSNLYAGMIADFDISSATGDSNKVATDTPNKMGYTYSTKTNGLYAGIKLLSTTAPANIYCFDNDTTGMGGIDLGHGGFSRAEKYKALSTPRATAGIAKPKGNDVLESVSSGPFTIAPGDSIEVAFAMLAGDNLSDIQTSAVNAQTKYNGVLLSTQPIATKEESYSLQSYPNPASGLTFVDVNLPQSGKMELKVYNLIGQDLITIASGEFSAGKHQFSLDASKLSNGVYYYQLTAGENKLLRKIVVSK